MKRALAGVSILLSTTLSGCGFVTTSVVAASSDDTQENGSPSVVGLSVTSTKVSPALIDFVLQDADELDEPSVVVSFEFAGQAGEIALCERVVPGEECRIDWDFAAVLGPEFKSGVVVTARARAKEVAVDGVNRRSVDLGNDPPEIEISSDRLPLDPDEAFGIVPIEFTVSDVASEQVDVCVEYNATTGFPEDGWRAAAPALGQDPVLECSIEGLTALPAGTTSIFAWDTLHDLDGEDVSVAIRMTAVEASEPHSRSLESTSRAFRVDNNEPPRIEFVVAELVAAGDCRRGIPIPLRFVDREGDDLRVVLQWTYEDEPFVDLPANPNELMNVLSNPGLRRKYRIAMERPVRFEGHAFPGSSDLIARLPELATTASLLNDLDAWTRGESVVGRDVVILAPRSELRGDEGRFGGHPRAILPIGGGPNAYVLDQTASFSWQIRRWDTSACAAFGPPIPGAEDAPVSMTYDADGKLLVLGASLSRWRVWRADPDDDSLALLHESDSTPDVPHDVCALGRGTALVTAGSQLIEVSFPTTAASSAVTISDRLVTPFGVVVHPGLPGHAIVAETDLGRLSIVDLASGTASPMILAGESPGRVWDLALSPDSNVLYVQRGNPTGADHFLEAFALERNDGSGGPGPAVARVAELGIFAFGISTGSDGWVGTVRTVDGTLFTRGGVEQVRRVTGYDPATQAVTVERPFEPALTPGARWRIEGKIPDRIPGDSGRVRLVWDSSEATRGGRVLLRTVPIDGDIGEISDPAAIEVCTSLGEERGVSIDSPQAVFAEDCDLDGNVDLVYQVGDVGASDVWLVRQSTPGSFSPPELLLEGAALKRVADVDGDGATDLITPGLVYFQDRFAPGLFGDAVAQFSGGSAFLDFADLDGDGRGDLVEFDGDGIFTVCLQTSPRIFGEAIEILDVSGQFTLVEESVGVHVADWNGDGQRDLLWATGFAVAVALGDGPMSFGEIKQFPLGHCEMPDEFFLQSIDVIDVDGDGASDVLAALANGSCDGLGTVGGTIELVMHHGRVSVGAPTVTPDMRRVVGADVDGDSRVDVVVVSGEQVLVFFQRSEGAFPHQPDLALEAAGAQLIVRDCDGDGRVDVFTAGSTTSRLHHHSLVGPLVPGPRVSVRDGFGIVGSAHSADYDGDGDLDLVTSEHGIRVYLQGPAGVFALGDQFPDHQANRILATDLGIVAEGTTGEGFGGNDYSVYFLPPAGTRRVRCGDSSAQVLDIDGDGGLELAACEELFAVPEWDSIVAVLPDGILADLDLDGTSEVVRSQGGNVVVHPQIARFEFAPSPTVLFPEASGEQVTGVLDIDGDGEMDIVVGNRIVFQEGGSWERSLLLPPGPFRVVDVDRDGDMDLCTADAVFEQTVGGGFIRVEASVPPEVGLPVIDLDGDGDLDFLEITTDGVALYYGGK